MEELRGKAVADNLHVEIAKQTEKLKAKGITPKLAVVRVGAREDDLAYERGILKKFANNNVDVIVKELPLDVDQETLDKEVKTLNEDPSVNGILMFRPLPKHLTDENIKSFIDPGKDVDVMGYGNMAGLFAGDKDAYAPCTAQAVMEILNFYGIETKGKNVTVIGRSLVIGKPVTLLLIGANATVTVCHTKTRDIKEECRRADIIVAAAGVAKMVTKDYVRPGQVIIDVGMNVDENGKLCGDVDFDEVSQIVDKITPVPGGVGAVTTSVLMKYTVNNAVKMNPDD